jgi:hypothetical protein
LTFSGAINGEMQIATTHCTTGNAGSGPGVTGTVGGVQYVLNIPATGSSGNTPLDVELYVKTGDEAYSSDTSGVTNFNATHGATLAVTLTSTGIVPSATGTVQIQGAIVC